MQAGGIVITGHNWPPNRTELNEDCDIHKADRTAGWNDPDANICNFASSLTNAGMEYERSWNRKSSLKHNVVFTLAFKRCRIFLAK